MFYGRRKGEGERYNWLIKCMVGLCPWWNGRAGGEQNRIQTTNSIYLLLYC